MRSSCGLMVARHLLEKNANDTSAGRKYAASTDYDEILTEQKNINARRPVRDWLWRQARLAVDPIDDNQPLRSGKPNEETYRSQGSWSIEVTQYAFDKMKFAAISELWSGQQSLKLAPRGRAVRLRRAGRRVKEVKKFLPVPVLDVVILAMPAMDEALDYIAIVVEHTRQRCQLQRPQGP